MKVKQQPDDFQVEELTNVPLARHGAHAFYRLEKRGWTTHDALAAVRRRWTIELPRLSYGGLKDRHARTVQYFTIFHGPRRNLSHQEVHVEYLGQLTQPYTSHDIRANRFTIVLRDMLPARRPAVEQALAEVRADGVPNYFDDQRFGSAGDGRFMARELVEGRFEEALKIALTAPYEFDLAEEKRAKAVLLQHWGDWKTCKDQLPKGHARSLTDYLVTHPTHFKGAVARLRPDLRGLYLSAYQSHLWNRMLARWLTEHCRPEQRLAIPLRLGAVPFHRGLDETQRGDLARLDLPLPTARTKLPPDDPRAPLMDAVLAEDGLQVRQMQVKGIRELFFSKGDRAALCQPADLVSTIADDELHAGKIKATLHFDLPRGSYATLVVKRIQNAVD